MGSAACWRLARRGARVLGLERFGLGHDRGSSGGETRMVRLAYFEHPDYVPLLRRAYELWDELGEAAGRPLLRRTGALYVGPPDGELVAGSTRSAREHGLPHEALDHERLAGRHPGFRVPAGWGALYEPDGGFVPSEPAVVAMARQAEGAGAEIRDREPVREWSAGPAGVTVTTDLGRYRSDRLILAAGPWMGGVAGGLGVELTVTRQVLGWVEPDAVEPFAPGAWPCWAIEHEGGLFYGFPALDDARTVKVGLHRRGPTADPDVLDRTPEAADGDELRSLLSRYLPSADGPVRRAHVCLYTWSPDGHFVVDRHPAHDRVWVACGFSGHGFKFAPVVGEALADLATEGRTDLPVGFLGLGRFAR